MGDNPGKGASSWESWATILGIENDHPAYNGKTGDISVTRFWILNCRDGGGRDIAENSRPPLQSLDFEN